MRTGLLLAALLAATPVLAAEKSGKLELSSPGPIAFGPGGVLFVGDPKANAVYAVTTGDASPRPAGKVAVEKLDAQLASLLGVKAADVQVVDLAVNPASGTVYLSVARGKGPDAIPVIFTVGTEGKLKEFPLDNVASTKADLGKPVADAKKRQEAITGIKFAAGKLYVAGLSNEEFASSLRAIPYPFDGKAATAGVQIFHGAHGRYETASPVRTFTTIQVNGEEEILAAYTCTPLVRIPTSQLKDGAKVKGKTVAELGNRNRPLDIVTYTKGGKSFALMANSARGVMKVELDGIDKIEAITARVADTAGTKYETIADLKGVEHLDKLGETQAVLLVRDAAGVSLRTIELP